MSRTLLCTHCYEPLGTSFIDDDGLGAMFCSDACRTADAVRRQGSSAAEIRVLVAIVHNQPMVQRQVAQNFIAMGWGNRVQRVKDEYGIAAIDMAWFTQAPRVDDLRNVALAQAMQDGFTHVLFLDADMLHPDDLFARILKYVDRTIVVSGFYTQRHHPFAPVALRDRTLHESGRFSTYKHDDDYRDVDADGLRDEDAVGMGCCLIPLAIVRALGPAPWFEYKIGLDGFHTVSEDMPFCERVKDAGFRICLDPTISCGHLFTDFATEQHWTRAREVIAHTQVKLAEALTLGVMAPDDVPAAAVGGA